MHRNPAQYRLPIREPWCRFRKFEDCTTPMSGAPPEMKSWIESEPTDGCAHSPPERRYLCTSSSGARIPTPSVLRDNFPKQQFAALDLPLCSASGKLDRS